VAPAAAAQTAAAKEAEVAKATAEAKRRPDEVAAMSVDEAARFADLLTAEGSGHDLEGELSNRRPGAELGAQIAAVREGGTQVAVGGGAGRAATGSGTALGGVRMPGEDPGGAVEVNTPAGRIAIAGKEALEDSTLTVDAVLMKIQSAYMAGMKRCYKQGLKQDPTLRGAVALAITVNETGRSVRPTSSGMNRELDACFEGLMANWRFPVPKDQDGEAMEAPFRIKLVLTPE
jgi:hypothetical protein